MNIKNFINNKCSIQNIERISIYLTYSVLGEKRLIDILEDIGYVNLNAFSNNEIYIDTSCYITCFKQYTFGSLFLKNNWEIENRRRSQGCMYKASVVLKKDLLENLIVDDINNPRALFVGIDKRKDFIRYAKLLYHDDLC